MADLATAAGGTDIASAAGGGVDFSKTIASIADSEKKTDADVSARNKAIDQTLSTVDRSDADIQKEVSSLSTRYEKTIAEADKPPPKDQSRSPIEALGSVTGALAALSGLLTRHPLTASLNAATAAIQGAKQGDAATFQREYDNWKTSSEHALQIGKLQNEQMKSILENKRLSVDEQLAKVRAYAAANQDEIAMQHARTGDLSTLWTLTQGREELAMRQRELQGKVDLQYGPASAIFKAQKDLIKAHQDGDEEAASKAVSEISEWGQVVKAMKGEGDKSPGTPQQVAMQKYLKEHPAATAEDARDFLKTMAEKPPSVGQQKQDEKVREVSDVLDLGDDTVKLIRGTTAAVGLSGKAARPLETLANVMEASDATSRRDIESNITTLRSQAVRLLNDRSIVTGKDHADAEKMIRGLEPGSTVQNTVSSIQTIQKLLIGKYGPDLKRLDLMSNGKAPAAAPAAAAPGAGGTRENPAKPTTQQEYDALPKGAYFMDDEGLKQK